MGHSAAGHGKPPAVTCPTDTSAAGIEAAIDATCPCAGKSGDSGPVAWRNHGQYVSCVVRYRNALRKAGCFADDSVRREVARCAARSTCGKSSDVVLCCHYQLGTCSDPNPADNIAAGTCSNGGAACNASADCTQSSASLAHDDAACTTDGGVVVVGGGSVCAPCPPPPPAS
jgi:hypothetical protein